MSAPKGVCSEGVCSQGGLLQGCLLRGMSAPRGGGCLLPGEGGVCSQGVSAPRRVSVLGGVCSGGIVCSQGGVCSGGCLLPGGVCFGGCLLLKGVCSWGMSAPGGGRVSNAGGCLPWGVLGIPACTEADTPPPSLTESQTPVKTLPWPNFIVASKNTEK